MKKLTIEEMRGIAKKRDGKCLSDLYVNTHTKLLWECAEGHQWKAVPTSIKSGKWCPKCAVKDRTEKSRGTIEEIQKVTEERGGKCLSDTYVNSQTKLLWECAEGHKWEAIPNSIKRGSWCPHCAGSAKCTIEEMQRIAEERGGKCLSDTFVNLQTNLLWECAEGHQWEAASNNIKSGTWCPVCGGTIKGTIEEIQRIAEERGGDCLSERYKNAQTLLEWRCAEGHVWKATPNSIKSGTWCLICAGLAKGTIEEMQKVAEERGGKCISSTYVNSKTNLLWECTEGHQWKATPVNIKRGRWCPDCSSGLGERICREFFEQIFSKKFPRSYPRWLVNKRENQMELDGYCKSLALAFEHHGEQHYTTKGKFIKSEEDLRQRQEDDRIKRELCKQQNVVLIEIPEIPNRLSTEDVKAFIKKECVINNVPLPSDYDTKEIDFNKAYATFASKEALNEMQGIAKKRGGKCLSHKYINSITSLLWECAKGHQWEAKPNSIKNPGTWCPVCGGRTKGTIEEMQEIAEERGGKCLSDTYVNTHTKLLWECVEGHPWEATPDNIKAGTWCPRCAGKAKCTIEEMHKIACERDGKCLSDTYVNDRTKLLWECAEGHKWKTAPSSIKMGTWCPHCAGSAKCTIGEIQRIAEERGGKCLSDTYVNDRTKLLWKCAEGHQWKAIPNSIKRGTWCRKCANRARKMNK
ncbi:MAG: hypothetical protein ACE5GV_12585 [Candidatus Scalindua sp.]